MRKTMKQEIPFQIEHLINSLLNKNDNVHVRGNYRDRLIDIKNAIDNAVKKYDNEAYITKVGKKRA